MDNFSTREMKCFLCPDLENDSICPMNVSFAGHSWEKIPDYVCAIQKIKIRGKEKFSDKLRKIQRPALWKKL